MGQPGGGQSEGGQSARGWSARGQSAKRSADSDMHLPHLLQIKSALGVAVAVSVGVGEAVSRLSLQGLRLFQVLVCRD